MSASSSKKMPLPYPLGRSRHRPSAMATLTDLIRDLRAAPRTAAPCRSTASKQLRAARTLPLTELAQLFGLGKGAGNPHPNNKGGKRALAHLCGRTVGYCEERSIIMVKSSGSGHLEVSVEFASPSTSACAARRRRSIRRFGCRRDSSDRNFLRRRLAETENRAHRPEIRRMSTKLPRTVGGCS